MPSSASPAFQQPEFVLKLSHAGLRGHISGVGGCLLQRHVLPGLLEEGARYCSVEGEAGEMLTIRFFERVERLQFAEQRLHLLRQFAFEALHLVGQGPRAASHQIADFLHEFTKGILGFASGNLGNEAGEKSALLTPLDLLQDLGELGVIHAFFQALEQREHLGGRFLVETRQKAVQSLLQRLFRAQADIDDVTGRNRAEVQRPQRLLCLRHLLRPQHDGAGVQGRCRDGQGGSGVGRAYGGGEFGGFHQLFLKYHGESPGQASLDHMALVQTLLSLPVTPRGRVPAAGVLFAALATELLPDVLHRRLAG